MEKVCSTCKRLLPLSAYYVKIPPDVLRSDCKECHKKVMRPRSKRHYEENKPYYRDRNKRRQQASYAFVRKYKEAHPTCMDCGLDHPPHRLDFDHLSDKEYNVSRMGGYGYGPEALLREIAKCEIVCANCHRDRTYARAKAKRRCADEDSNLETFDVITVDALPD